MPHGIHAGYWPQITLLLLTLSGLLYDARGLHLTWAKWPHMSRHCQLALPSPNSSLTDYYSGPAVKCPWTLLRYCIELHGISALLLLVVYCGHQCPLLNLFGPMDYPLASVASFLWANAPPIACLPNQILYRARTLRLLCAMTPRARYGASLTIQVIKLYK